MLNSHTTYLTMQIPSEIWSIVSEYLPISQRYRNKRVSSIFLNTIRIYELDLDDLSPDIKSHIDLNVVFPDLDAISMSYDMNLDYIVYYIGNGNSFYHKTLKKLIIKSENHYIHIGGFSAENVEIILKLSEDTMRNINFCHIYSIINNTKTFSIINKSTMDSLHSFNIVHTDDILEHINITNLNTNSFAVSCPHINSINLNNCKVYSIATHTCNDNIITNFIPEHIYHINLAKHNNLTLYTYSSSNEDRLYALINGVCKYIANIWIEEEDLTDILNPFLNCKLNIICMLRDAFAKCGVNVIG